MKLAIVVPMLNEVETVSRLAESLLPIQAEGAEILLADGGSTDGCVAAARAAGLRVLDAPQGRARQMNAGAAAAGGDVLLFVHADTILPPQALSAVLGAVANGHRVWGRFDVRIEGRAALLPVVAWLMNWRSRLTGVSTGDQGLFATRAAFEAVGGFPDQPLMEDLELAQRLRALSRPACLRDRVVTSGRRWERNGVWQTIWLMWRLRLAYWLGASPHDLATRYR